MNAANDEIADRVTVQTATQSCCIRASAWPVANLAWNPRGLAAPKAAFAWRAPGSKRHERPAWRKPHSQRNGL